MLSGRFSLFCFFFQAEDGIRYLTVTGVQTCALPIYVPTEGKIWRYGTAMDGPSRDVAIVFQEHVLFPWATVLENVMLPADVLGLPKAPARERAFRLLEITGLTEFAGHRPHMLSG